MKVRIACFAIAVIFLLTGVIYSVQLLYTYIKEDDTEPFVAQEPVETLDLGSLDNFQPPAQPLTEISSEIIAKGEGDKAVIETDVVTLKTTYASAVDGKIFQNYFTQSELGYKYLSYTSGFQALLPTWQEYILDAKIGRTYRILIPRAEIDKFLVDASNTPSNQDVVLDLQLVGIADRNLTGFLQQSTLDDFQPLKQALADLRIEDLVEGSGRVVQQADEVVVNYIGVKANDGSVFDAQNAVSLNLNNVITGWKLGMLEMKVGGKRRIFIPATLAYNDEGHQLYQTDLIFDVELLAINDYQEDVNE